MVNWISKEEAFPLGSEFADHPYSEIALEMATGVLFQLTGEKFQGTYSTTEVYGSNSQTRTALTEPVLSAGKFYNVPRGSSGSSGHRRLRLRNQPVLSVEEVVYRGKVLDPTSYQLRNNSFIVQTNKAGWFFDGTSELEVTYTYGANPPAMGKEACIRLAEEFVMAFTNDSRCSLPDRITAITRQNVSMTIMDPQEFLKEGRTGVYMVDLFIKTYNPTGALKKNKLVVPGQPYSERIN